MCFFLRVLTLLIFVRMMMGNREQINNERQKVRYVDKTRMGVQLIICT